MADTRRFLAGTAVLVLFAGVTQGVVGLVFSGADAGPSLNLALSSPAVIDVNRTDPGTNQPSRVRSTDPDPHADFTMSQ